jgi:hypothetical protein
MPRISKYYLMRSALALLALSAQQANAASPGAFGSGARPRPPTITNIGRPVVTDQQLSFWGVQTATQQKRDRLNSKYEGNKPGSSKSGY